MGVPVAGDLGRDCLDDEPICLQFDKEGKVRLSLEDIDKIAALTAKMVLLNLKRVKKDD